MLCEVKFAKWEKHKGKDNAKSSSEESDVVINSTIPFIIKTEIQYKKRQKHQHYYIRVFLGSEKSYANLNDVIFVRKEIFEDNIKFTLVVKVNNKQ